MSLSPFSPLSTLADAQPFARDGFTFRPLAVPSRGSAELAVWALDLVPGARSETHSMDREEVFVVVDGAVSATVADREVSAGPGDAIIVPPHATLQIRNASTAEPARLTVATSVGMRAIVGGAPFTPPWAQ
ncbi:Cupin 2 conserved barrel domain protein [Catenulispora acidiphila DSM 44928]|uniref:Cupin 2 conserved barrel domain protein n=1 Tax=Catenulispora acidiphila (strain DSM 44928 / JCM 14897 / NBRC 102108 / NRRL B-24433 / ID139908) TaxID=479433 RepID=C7QF71_CATAD|nr:cupin domain-containing protein [Catenulispora acidiphila]ACU74829.1 Cupin 2 conserved barrel domain protein [Catenulispora acidiphila DSM 44928]